MVDIKVSNYINIYFWRALSLISGFLSLIIVVPHLTTQPELYGIYVFCISFALYLSYSDLGFLSAGQKFAAEEYAKHNLPEEISITGFTMLLLMILFVPFSVFMVYLSTDPSIVLSDLSDKNTGVASDFFLIIGLLLPIQVIVQRLVEFILIIRLQDYLALRVNITVNLIKIFSVYFFFYGDLYLLTEYYLFSTLITILGSFIAIYIVNNSIEYDFHLLAKSLKLSAKYYNKGKRLAFSSFALTVSFILYYELDLIIIGKWFGVQEVAIYAIGFTFLNFVRSLWNILYSPFSQRLNHFYGQGMIEKIKYMLSKLIEYTFPLYIVLVTVIYLGADTLVTYWVGEQFQESIQILQILMLSTVCAVIIRPASYYFVTFLKYKYIYLQAVILPVVFFASILLLSTEMGMVSLAVAKVMVSIVSVFVAVAGLMKVVSLSRIAKKVLLSSTIGFGLMCVLLPRLLEQLFPDPQKSVARLVSFLICLAAIVIFSYLVIILSGKERREELNKAKMSFFNKS